MLAIDLYLTNVSTITFRYLQLATLSELLLVLSTNILLFVMRKNDKIFVAFSCGIVLL